jgi:hypothetical protein
MGQQLEPVKVHAQDYDVVLKGGRVAWLPVLFALPVVGVIAYLLLGETSIGRFAEMLVHLH